MELHRTAKFSICTQWLLYENVSLEDPLLAGHPADFLVHFLPSAYHQQISVLSIGRTVGFGAKHGSASSVQIASLVADQDLPVSCGVSLAFSSTCGASLSNRQNSVIAKAHFLLCVVLVQPKAVGLVHFSLTADDATSSISAAVFVLAEITVGGFFSGQNHY